MKKLTLQLASGAASFCKTQIMNCFRRGRATVVSIDLLLFSFMPFSYSGIYFRHKKPLPNTQSGILLLQHNVPSYLTNTITKQHNQFDHVAVIAKLPKLHKEHPKNY